MIFHLAIPAKDVSQSREFYESIGAKVGRTYPNNAILDFFGIQLVIHKSDDCDKKPTMYPRHFGVIVTQSEFDTLYSRFFAIAHFPVMSRYPGMKGEHHTFFLCDPANNLIEFKYYKDQGDVFS